MWRYGMGNGPTHDQEQSLESVKLRRGYSVLREPGAQLPEIKKALSDILERVGNNDDCFWISHAWAESLISGGTIARRNFPEIASLELRRDPDWKRNQPDYKGAYLSKGAERYIVTEWTKGKNNNLPPREYTNLKEFESLEELKKDLRKMQNGSLKMVLPLTYSTLNAGGHALLVARINSELLVIDNSFEPGAWIKSWSDLAREYKNTVGFCVYDYPEKIHSLK